MPTGFPDYYGGLTLPVTVPEGGTGLTTIPANALLLGNTTGVMVPTNVGTANQVLQVPSGGGAPQFQSIAINAGAISGILPIANGGTGTATPALVAGTGISLAGSWPNNTITNSSAYAALADPLPVAHGGTGTATPALVAGTNITITGSWPNQTVKLTTGPFELASDLLLDNNFKLEWKDTFGGLPNLQYQVDNNFVFRNTDASDALYAVFAHQGHATNAGFDFFVPLSLSTPLAVSSGGTGATSLAGAGLLQVLTTITETAQTAGIGPITIVADAGGSSYLLGFTAHVHSPTAASSLTVSVTFTYDGVSFTQGVVVNLGATAGDAGQGAATCITGDSSTAITFTASFGNGGGADDYDLVVVAIKV